METITFKYIQPKKGRDVTEKSDRDKTIITFPSLESIINEVLFKHGTKYVMVQLSGCGGYIHISENGDGYQGNFKQLSSDEFEKIVHELVRISEMISSGKWHDKVNDQMSYSSIRSPFIASVAGLVLVHNLTKDPDYVVSEKSLFAIRYLLMFADSINVDQMSLIEPTVMDTFKFAVTKDELSRIRYIKSSMLRKFYNPVIKRQFAGPVTEELDDIVVCEVTPNPVIMNKTIKGNFEISHLNIEKSGEKKKKKNLIKNKKEVSSSSQVEVIIRREKDNSNEKNKRERVDLKIDEPSHSREEVKFEQENAIIFEDDNTPSDLGEIPDN